MKSRIQVILFLSFIFLVSCKRNSKDESMDSKRLDDNLLETALSTDDDSIEEVSIVFYEGKKEINFQPQSNFVFKIKKGNSYLKYNNFSEKDLSKGVEDSVLIKDNEKDKIDDFFKHENTLLKNVYGNTTSEKPVWKIFFMNKEQRVFKFININGEPKNQNIKGLKASCDFLLKKIEK